MCTTSTTPRIFFASVASKRLTEPPMTGTWRMAAYFMPGTRTSAPKRRSPRTTRIRKRQITAPARLMYQRERKLGR